MTRASRAPRRDLAAIVRQGDGPRAPAERYPTAQALADDLKRFATGQLVGARHYSTWALVRRWLRRHRATAARGPALVVALRGGRLLATSLRERNRTAAENNRLRLMQAQAVLDHDPTAAAAWLKTHQVEPGDERPRGRGGGARRRGRHRPPRAHAAGRRRPPEVCLADYGQARRRARPRRGRIWLFDLRAARAGSWGR